MGLRKRGEIYHYDFRVGGVRYQGSTHKTQKREAKAVEEVWKREAKAQAKSSPRPVVVAATNAVPTVGELAARVKTAKLLTRRDTAYFRNLSYLAATIGDDLPIDQLDNAAVIKLIVAERVKGLVLGVRRLGSPGPVDALIPDEFRPEAAIDRPLSAEELSGVLETLADHWAEAEPPRAPLGTASIIHNVIRPIKALLAQARLEGATPQWLPILREGQFPDYSRNRVMSHEEEARLREVTPPDAMDIYDFALQSMLRRGNIVRLRWSEVDLELRLIHVKVKGKIAFSRHINNAMYEILLRQVGMHPEFVFTRLATLGAAAGKRVPITSWVAEWFKVYCERAGIRDLRFHDLRRTGATRMYAATRDIREVQAALGHLDVQTTWKYVSRVAGDRERAERMREEADLQARGRALAAREDARAQTPDAWAERLATVSDEDLAGVLARLPTLRGRLLKAARAPAPAARGL